jgi:hypothetical protein
MLVTLSRKNDMDVVESEPTAPALAVIGGAASGMRFLLSPGHHVVGRGGESDFVVPDLFLSREHVRVVVDDRLVAISDGGSTNGTYVNGERLTAQRTLADNDVVEAGASLFCVRNPPVDDRTPVVPVPGEADADLLMQLGRRDRDRLQRLAANRAGVVVRVGFAASTSGARARPQAITVNIATSLVAIRGTAEARAALARWLLVQAVTTHAPHRLAVAAALGPVPGDIWDWVGTIPHAHAELGVLAGSRVATDRATGAAMLARLRDLVNARRRQTRDVVDGVPAPFVPLVLAFADSSIASGDDVDALAGGRDVQVHVVWLGRPDQTPPIAMETIVDLDGTTGDVVVHHPATGDPAITGIADGLSTDLARQAARDFLRA